MPPSSSTAFALTCLAAAVLPGSQPTDINRAFVHSGQSLYSKKRENFGHNISTYYVNRMEQVQTTEVILLKGRSQDSYSPDLFASKLEKPTDVLC